MSREVTRNAKGKKKKVRLGGDRRYRTKRVLRESHRATILKQLSPIRNYAQVQVLHTPKRKTSSRREIIKKRKTPRRPRRQKTEGTPKEKRKGKTQGELGGLRKTVV